MLEYLYSVILDYLKLQIQEHCQLVDHVIIEILCYNEGLRSYKWLIASNYRMLHYGCATILEYWKGI